MGPSILSTILGRRRTGAPAPGILYGCAALVIVILLVTDALLVLHLRHGTIRAEETNLRNLSLTLAEEADRSFQSFDLILSSVVGQIAPQRFADRRAFARGLGGQDVHQLLAEKIGGFPQLGAIILFGAGGREINSSRSWPAPPREVSAQMDLQAAEVTASGKRFITKPVRDPVTHEWTAYLTRPIRGAHGTVLGFVAGAVRLPYYEDLFRAIALEPDSTLNLQRDDRILLARYPHTSLIGVTLPGHDPSSPASAIKRDASPVDGRMHVKAFHALPHYPLVVVATVTEASVLRDWLAQSAFLTLAVLGCAASVALATWILARHWRQREGLAQARADAERTRALAAAELQRQEERNAAYEALRAAKEAAEVASRTKSEFLATMSHELRTPLNAVIGFSELMLSEAMGPLGNDRYRGYLGDIHASAEHLLDLINDILDLSKAEAGRLELAEDWVDARAVVDAVSRLVGHRARQASLDFEARLPAGQLAVYADERKLKQMLLNLLSNAIKFTKPGGRIELRVTADAGGLAFAIEDSGIGIAEASIDRVTQPFVQLDNALTRQHAGTGLGLTLVKAMAELHGGALRIVSEEGVGTVATIVLPVVRLARNAVGASGPRGGQPIPIGVV